MKYHISVQNYVKVGTGQHSVPHRVNVQYHVDSDSDRLLFDNCLLLPVSDSVMELCVWCLHVTITWPWIT